MKKNVGILITLIAAICWGFSGTCAQYIFDNFDADPTYLTAVRLLAAGLILVVIGLFTDRKNMTAIWTDKKSALRLIFFSVTGFLFCQLSYMKAISYSNSGTATILQYLGPVLIMIVSCFLARKLPQRKEVFAIIMALIGVFLIATHGHIDTMVITPLGLSWGLWSAVALMLYTMLPGKIIEKYGSITVTGYGMLLGGIFLCIGCGIWKAPMVYDIRCIIAFIAIVIFGTILPFTMYLIGVNRCGAVKASMLASIEPVAATVFMVVWLRVPLQMMDIAGFLCIFVTIFLLTKKETEAITETAEKDAVALEPSNNGL